jgi:transposase InsO family protein
VKFAFIDDHRAAFPVEALCRVLGVTRSGYYAWRTRKPSVTARRRAELDLAIRTAYDAGRANYGSPRVHRELKAGGVACCENTVAKRMRACGLRAKTKRRFRVCTTDSRHTHAPAPNRLDRRFSQPKPNCVWAADITYIPTREGWLYLAAVIDLCSRQVVGWATADHLRAELACRALREALMRRRPSSELLHHSDRGVQYACEDYRNLLSRYGLEASMSRTGNCYDNAVVESFFGTLKKELVHHEDYPTRAAAHQSLFEYIEVFYNRRRRHSALGYVSPAEYEAALN